MRPCGQMHAMPYAERETLLSACHASDTAYAALHCVRVLHIGCQIRSAAPFLAGAAPVPVMHACKRHIAHVCLRETVCASPYMCTPCWHAVRCSCKARGPLSDCTPLSGLACYRLPLSEQVIIRGHGMAIMESWAAHSTARCVRPYLHASSSHVALWGEKQGLLVSDIGQQS